MFVPLLWIKEAFTGLFRNFWWNVAAFVLTFVCLVAFSLSYVAGNNAEHFSNLINDKLTIQIDVKDEVTSYATINSELMDDPRIKEVEFVSKEEAERIMTEEMGEDSVILGIFEENIFPAQFVVHLHEPEQIETVASELENAPYADKILYGKEYAETLLSFTSKFEKTGLYVTIAAGVFVIFLVMLAIKMNIEQRRDEIKIKQLIGSGMMTIKMPFILESLILMGVASAATYFSFVYLYGQFEIYFQQKFANNGFYILSSASVGEDLILPLFGLAIALGFFGSLVSTNRKLKRI